MSVFEYLIKTDNGYIVKSPVRYDSKRYGKTVFVKKDFPSDGATCFPDIDSYFWLFHDYLKFTRKWRDGSHCSNHQSSVVVWDILMAEKRYIIAPVVFTGVYVYGYTKQFFKGLFR
jgi:hypothetical protein